MVRMFVRHDVSDYVSWRKAYDDFDAARRAMGVEGDAVFQSTDDPNDVTIWHDFADRARADAFVASEQLRSAMQKAGVRGQPTIWFTTPT